MNALVSIDQQFFLFINHVPHLLVADEIAKFFSFIGSAGLVWFFFGMLLFLKEERKHPLFFVPIIVAGGVSWLLVEIIIKPLVGRMRPTIDMGAIIVGSMKHDPSFPSGHATIAWAMAIVLSTYEPRWKKYFFVLAALISLSRVYLGVHYPLDVLGGTGIGIIIGWLSLLLKNFGRRKWIRKS